MMHPFLRRSLCWTLLAALLCTGCPAAPRSPRRPIAPPPPPANLGGATLIGAYLFRAQLHRATLSGAELYRANLREADLRETNLRNADLRGADLRWARLQGADVSGADLDGARICRVWLDALVGYRGRPAWSSCKAKNKTDAGRCRRSNACRKQGACTLRSNKCVATSNKDCRASEWCKWMGACSVFKGTCVAATQQDCAASEGCKRMGMCRLTGTFCSEGRAAVVRRKKGSANDWYYLKGKSTVGPVSTKTLLKLFSMKSFDGRTLLWRKGLSGWTHLAAFKPFRKLPIWYYLKNKKKAGPVSTQLIRGRIKAKLVTSKTLLWRKGFLKWRPLLAIPELNDTGRWKDPYRSR